MSARVMLATMGDTAGLSRPEVGVLIFDVEMTMNPEDVETHLQLRGAYDIGLGDLPYDEKARRRFISRQSNLGQGSTHASARADLCHGRA